MSDPVGWRRVSEYLHFRRIPERYIVNCMRGKLPHERYFFALHERNLLIIGLAKATLQDRRKHCLFATERDSSTASRVFTAPPFLGADTRSERNVRCPERRRWLPMIARSAMTNDRFWGRAWNPVRRHLAHSGNRCSISQDLMCCVCSATVVS